MSESNRNQKPDELNDYRAARPAVVSSDEQTATGEAPTASEVLAAPEAPPAPEALTAPTAPEALTAPPAPEALTAPPAPEALTAPTAFDESPAVIRARHLELLREAVDSGEYRADPGKIAQSMMENERS